MLIWCLTLQLIMQQMLSQPVTQQPVDPFMQQMAAPTHKNPVMHLLSQLHLVRYRVDHTLILVAAKMFVSLRTGFVAHILDNYLSLWFRCTRYPASYSGCPVSKPHPRDWLSWKALYGFPLSVQACVRIVPLNKTWLLQPPFPFTVFLLCDAVLFVQLKMFCYIIQESINLFYTGLPEVVTRKCRRHNTRAGFLCGNILITNQHAINRDGFNNNRWLLVSTKGRWNSS